MNRSATAGATAIAALAFATHAASAQELTITFENLLPSGGTAFTPVFFGLSDASFDLFNPGESVTAGLEQVTELGSTATLAAEFSAASPSGLSATTSTGPITGGNSAQVNFNVTDPANARFLSFASMVVPTNDLFVGNPAGIEVFDEFGNFNGPITITILGTQVWDAGTEVNNADDGAAFLQGIDGTAGTAEGGTAALFFESAGATDYLASLLGRTTAPGFDIQSTFGRDTAIAQITIVPTPASASLLGLAGVAAIRRRR